MESIQFIYFCLISVFTRLAAKRTISRSAMSSEERALKEIHDAREGSFFDQVF